MMTGRSTRGAAVYTLIYFIAIIGITLYLFFCVNDGFAATIYVFGMIAVANFLISCYYGKYGSKLSWLIVPVCMIAGAASIYVTFDLSNIISNGGWNAWNTPEPGSFIYPAAVSVLGYVIGKFRGESSTTA